MFTASDFIQQFKNHDYQSFVSYSNVTIRSFKWKLSNKLSQTEFPDCKTIFGELGKVKVPVTLSSQVKLIKLNYPYLYSGGVWAPDDCKPKENIAILVPYKNRSQNLAVFLPHIHNFLQLQQQSYGIYIIEQRSKGTQRFNRGKLLNIGFILTQVMFNYSCYILHDVDKVPLDARYLYTCGDRPVHMPLWYHHGKSHRLFSGHIYPEYFGGVSSIRAEHFVRVNGMVNNFWGWGAEDDDLYSRLNISGITPVLSFSPYAQFYLLKHKQDAQYSKRSYPMKHEVKRRMRRQGINSLKFNLVDIKYATDHTLISVEV